jgi:hypothetical protein
VRGEKRLKWWVQMREGKGIFSEVHLGFVRRLLYMNWVIYIYSDKVDSGRLY